MLDELRRSTGAAHARLEAHLAVFDRLEAEGPIPLLIRFHGLHEGVEAVVEPRAAALPELDFERRRKIPAVQRDLRRAGVPADAIARIPVMPIDAPTTTAELLGMLYVVEGSTLGGRMIHKECRRRGLDGANLAFFDVYGAETGAMWRRLCSLLEAHGASGLARAQACRAAAATFEAAENWLTAGTPAVAKRAVA